MEQELIAQSAPGLIALAVALAGLAVILMGRRRLRSRNKPKTARNLARAREKKIARVEQQALKAIGKDSERTLRTDRIAKSHPGVSWLALFEQVQDWVASCEQARGASDPSLLPEGLTEMAQEQVMQGHRLSTGLQALRHGPRWLITADGTADGIGLRVATLTWLDEMRGDEVVQVEAHEIWHLGLREEGSARVIGIERRWRALMQAPVWNAHPRRPVLSPRKEPDLLERVEALTDPLDIEALGSHASRVATALMTAHCTRDLTPLTELATPAFVTHLTHQWHRDEAFDCQRRWAEVTVAQHEVSRLLVNGGEPTKPPEPVPTVWVQGRAEESLWRGEQCLGSATRDWVRYLTFIRGSQGQWLLDHIDDEETIVV